MSLWKPMLAAKPDPAELEAALARLRYPLLASPKLDGIRATVQDGRLYSRSLKPIPNRAMQALWGCTDLEGLDGEIVVGPPTAGDCFNRSTSVVMSRDKAAAGAVFYTFDHYDGAGLPFKHRYERMVARVAACGPASYVVPVVHTLLEKPSQLAAYEKKVLRQGYEGVMLRDLAGSYKQGRSTLREGGLVAVKRFVDAEAVVLGVYEQMENTNPRQVNELGRSKRSSAKAGKVGKGTLGGFDCELLSDGRYFSIGTGQGLTDDVRTTLWTRRKELVGKVIKFRYQQIGTKNVPRQPIFLGFRDERDL